MDFFVTFDGEDYWTEVTFSFLRWLNYFLAFKLTVSVLGYESCTFSFPRQLLSLLVSCFTVVELVLTKSIFTDTLDYNTVVLKLMGIWF